jgi:putative endonuclease
MSHYLKGLHAEMLAALWLRLKGWRILDRRLRTPLGEIDLLAEKRETLILVEVKLRPTLTEAASAISPHQQARLVNAARFVLAKHPEMGNHTVRFDTLLVNRWGGMKHVVNAWNENRNGN